MCQIQIVLRIAILRQYSLFAMAKIRKIGHYHSALFWGVLVVLVVLVVGIKR